MTSKKTVILLADWDERMRGELRNRLHYQGFQVHDACNKLQAERALQRNDLHLAVLGSSQNGGWDGLDLVDEIRRRDRRLPIILIGTHSSEERVITALRAGVKDYFKRPYSLDELLASIQRNVHRAERGALVTDSVADDGPLLIGESSAMRQIKTYLRKVAASACNVLIEGETGTGKEIVARLIHQYSSRCNNPLVCINCAALPDDLLESELFGHEKGAFTGAHASYEGKLKLAQGGTVFFDEIGEMSPYAQAKMLRAIESKSVDPLGSKQSIPLDIRFVAATNQDLERKMAENQFRKDLFYRLNVGRIQLPPLRERKEDLPLLLDHYLNLLNSRCCRNVEGFDQGLFDSLLRYDWPGNVRELANLLEAIFIDPPVGRITIADLPNSYCHLAEGQKQLATTERQRLLSALFATSWNKSRAAKELRWSRMTLYRKMKKYHINSSTQATPNLDEAAVTAPTRA